MNQAAGGIVLSSAPFNIAPAPPTTTSLFTARPEAQKRVRDYFSSHIRNPTQEKNHETSHITLPPPAKS